MDGCAAFQQEKTAPRGGREYSSFGQVADISRILSGHYSHTVLAPFARRPFQPTVCPSLTPRRLPSRLRCRTLFTYGRTQPSVTGSLRVTTTPPSSGERTHQVTSPIHIEQHLSSRARRQPAVVGCYPTVVNSSSYRCLLCHRFRSRSVHATCISGLRSFRLRSVAACPTTTYSRDVRTEVPRVTILLDSRRCRLLHSALSAEDSRVASPFIPLHPSARADVTRSPRDHVPPRILRIPH